MRKISVQSNINSELRSTEEAHIPANRAVGGRSRSHTHRLGINARDPAHHQKADPLTVGSSCSSTRCVSPRRRTKRRCSASHTPDTLNPSLLFSAGKVLPSLSLDQIIKSVSSKCVNTRGQLADRVPVSAGESWRSAEEAPPLLSLLLAAHTGATCLFYPEKAPPLRSGVNQ